jgi:Uma2 family endonuclease
MATELTQAATEQRPTRWKATIEEFWALPESVLPTEYINGEIIMAPAPSVAHQTALRNVFTRLDQFARQTGLWECLFAPLDVVLPTGDVVQPDIVLLTKDELARADKRIELAPSLLVEILSPGSRRRDAVTKRSLYEQCGVREYWLVDPMAQTIKHFVLHAGHYTLTELAAADTLRSIVLDGFTAPVAKLLGLS